MANEALATSNRFEQIHDDHHSYTIITICRINVRKTVANQLSITAYHML